jgi:cell fate regulator YaaT (PSP1 superfamily)
VVLRKASEGDLKQRHELDGETGKALEVFDRLKEEHRLEMRIVGAHWRLDRKKICFYFASEERFDFRALHKAVSAALDSRVATRDCWAGSGRVAGICAAGASYAN